MKESSVAGMYHGGLGKSYELSNGHKRQTIKALEQSAANLNDAALIAAGQGDAAPTLILGRA